MKQCLKLFVSSTVKEDEFGEMVVQPGPKSWTINDRCWFLEECFTRSVPIHDQKQIFHLIQSYDVHFEVFRNLVMGTQVKSMNT